MQRFESESTIKELESSLNYIFPIEKSEGISVNTVNEDLKRTEETREGGQYLFWSDKLNGIIAIIYNIDLPRRPCCGILLSVINKPQNTDLAFGNYFCKVFNDDIKLFPNQVTHSEIWLSLRQTQFRRSIAKFSAFSTEPMIKWLQIVENSVSLKYENKPFSFCLFMTKKMKSIRDPLKDEFVPFSNHIPFERGIMGEKWIRGSMSGQTVGLAGYGFAGDLFGMFAIPQHGSMKANDLLSPHEELIPIVNLLIEGTCLFLTTQNGDIYFMLPNQAIFYKTQGRWFYINYANLKLALKPFFDESVLTSILRLILNLSFERHGALVFVPETDIKLNEIIPDFRQKERVNLDIRKTLNGLNISNSTHRKIIQSSSKIDGALVLSKNGLVLDVACIIGQPSESKLKDLKMEKLERFPGARSTAAWSASLYGIAIKVSEDGPVTIFRHGKIIGQVG